MRLWLISYDMSDDRQRRAMEKLLYGFGEKVYFTVFECALRAEQFKRLWQAMTELIDPATDSLRAYPICIWCEERVRFQGRGRKPGLPIDWIL